MNEKVAAAAEAAWDDNAPRGDEPEYVPSIPISELENLYPEGLSTFDSSQELGDLFGAMAKCQAEVGKAHKLEENTFFGSAYADLSAIVDAFQDAMAKNGLSLIQLPSVQKVQSEGKTGIKVALKGILAHGSGQWISSTLEMPCEKMNAHGVGSAIAYARKYQAKCYFMVADKDDDGNAAIEPPVKKR